MQGFKSAILEDGPKKKGMIDLPYNEKKWRLIPNLIIIINKQGFCDL
jgi:hypothetical protein